MAASVNRSATQTRRQVVPGVRRLSRPGSFAPTEQEPPGFVIHFHRWRESPCALVSAHLVARVHLAKSASSPAFLRARLPEECEARGWGGIGMLGQSPHLIGGILWIQNPMRGMLGLFLPAPSSGMVGMSAPAGQPG